MTVIALPADPIPFSAASFELMRADEALEFTTGAVQVTAFSKALWRASWRLPRQAKAGDFRLWRAALAQLSHLGNTFTQRPPEYTGPTTGYAGAGPLVKGASQLGKSLICDGVTVSDPIVKAGDYLSVIAGGKRELKIVTADASSDVGGNVTFAFEPALRNAPADNAAVEIVNPLAEFRLAAPLGAWQIDLLLNGELAIEAIESFSP
jgi:hypothetical protein